MTPEQEVKRVQRAIRNIPVDAIAPHITASESAMDGRWCLVGGVVEFVPADGGTCETTWDDPVEYAQYRRWLGTHPDRVHDTRGAAVEYVRGAMNHGGTA